MTLHDALSLVQAVLLVVLAMGVACLWVSTSRCHAQREELDAIKACVLDADFKKAMEARLATVEANLEHMTRLLANLVEIRNQK